MYAKIKHHIKHTILFVGLSTLSACTIHYHNGTVSAPTEQKKNEERSSPAQTTTEVAGQAHKPDVAQAEHTSFDDLLAKQPACDGYGPQTPRDIDNKSGANTQLFTPAPAVEEMNLCNIHMHNNAEHKAKDFAFYAGHGEHGHGGGFQCNMSKSLTAAELKVPKGEVCHGLKPGDTVEVHWVHSSCKVKPGKTLGACMSEKCSNPELRVEAQIFTLVNDSKALNFNDFDTMTSPMNGFYHVKHLPTYTGKPVEFLGSTTGEKYDDLKCSPMQVTWSVRPQCAKLDINSLAKWCEHNVFEEEHAHGVRPLVVNPKLLAPIK